MLCMGAGAVSAVLAVQSFTLAWMHSIEKVRWEEDWVIEQNRLRPVAARIRGTGAGMEPPPDAVFRDGAWHYRPLVGSMERVNLAHSPYTSGYELCLANGCRPLADFLPGISEVAVIELRACPE